MRPETEAYREDDEEALLRAAQADPAAFAPLYRLHVGKVYAYLRARTDSPEEADDLTQQTFLQALVALPRYRSRPGVPFVGWLLRIARNLAINASQRRRTFSLAELPERLQPVVAHDP